MTKKTRHSIQEKRHRKKIAILAVLIGLVAACLCFVFGYAIAEGWSAVGAWFTSKWATLTIVTLLIVITALLYGYFAIRDRKDFK